MCYSLLCCRWCKTVTGRAQGVVEFIFDKLGLIIISLVFFCSLTSVAIDDSMGDV